MKKKSILKGIGIFFALLIIGLAVFIFYITRNIDKFADNQLRRVISKSPLPYHSINYSSVHLKLNGGILILKDISIKPDTLLLKDTILREKSFKNLVEFSCDELRITGINLFKLLVGKSLDVDTLILQKPFLRYIQSGLEDFRDVRYVGRYLPTDIQPPPKNKKLRIRWIHTGELILNEGKLIIGMHGEERPLTKNKSFTLVLSDLSIDLKKLPDRTKGIELKDMNLQIEQEEIALPGGMYALYTGKVNLSMSEAYVRIDTLRLIPLHDNKEFAKILGNQKERFDVQVGSIEVIGIDLLDSYRNSSLKIRKLLVDHLNLQAYKDKTYPFDFSKFPALPQESIGKMKNYLKIDSILVSNGFIEYLELKPGAHEPGRIFLDSLDATAVNITNDSIAIKTNDTLTVNGHFRLMGSGKANVNIFLPLGKNDGSFEFNGVMYGMTVKTLNSYLEPNVRARINAGYVSKVEFYVQARNNVTTGKFRLLYNGLNLTVLPKYGAEDETQGKKFLSFIANKLVRSDNPKNGIEEISNLYFERNRNKGVFNFMIKTLLQGCIDIAAPSDKNIEKKKVGGDEKTSGKKKK